MAFTPEQQAQIDFQNALDANRVASQTALQTMQTRLEAVRIAQATLIENARSKAVNERDVAAADITTFADTLMTYINA